MDNLNKYLAGFDLPYVDINPSDATEEHDKEWHTLEASHARKANRFRVLRGRAWQARVHGMMAEDKEEKDVVSEIATSFGTSASTVRRYRRLAVGVQDIFDGKIAIVGNSAEDMVDALLSLPLGGALKTLSNWRRKDESGNSSGVDNSSGGDNKSTNEDAAKKAADLRQKAIQAALALPEDRQYSALQDLIEDAMEAQKELPASMQPLDDHKDDAGEPTSDDQGIFGADIDSPEEPVDATDDAEDEADRGDPDDDGAGSDPDDQVATKDNKPSREELVDKALTELRAYGQDGSKASVIADALGMDSKKVAALLREGGATPFRRCKGRYAANWTHPDFKDETDQRMST